MASLTKITETVRAHKRAKTLKKRQKKLRRKNNKKKAKKS